MAVVPSAMQLAVAAAAAVGFAVGVCWPRRVKPPAPLLLVAGAAVICRRRGVAKVLLAQRPAGGAFAGLWEFPGGKLEAGELPDEAAARELSEELQLRVRPAELQAVGFSTAALGASSNHLLMLLLVLDYDRTSPSTALSTNAGPSSSGSCGSPRTSLESGRCLPQMCPSYPRCVV